MAIHDTRTGAAKELDNLLAQGLASREMTEGEFWDSVNKRTDFLVGEHKTDKRS